MVGVDGDVLGITTIAQRQDFVGSDATHGVQGRGDDSGLERTRYNRVWGAIEGDGVQEFAVLSETRRLRNQQLEDSAGILLHCRGIEVRVRTRAVGVAGR